MKSQDLLTRYSKSLPDGCCASYTALAREFLEWAGSRPIWADVPGPNGMERVASADLVRKYMDHLRREKYAPGTVRKNWALIRRFYVVNKIEWPFRRGDAPIVPEREIRAYAMPVEKVEKMIDVVLGRTESIELNPLPQHVAYLILSTVWGLRREEIAEITADRINAKLSDGYGALYVATLKKGRQRYHLLPSYLIPPLTAFGFEQPRSVDYVSNVFSEMKIMCGFIGDQYYGSAWHSIRRAADKALKAAKIDPVDRRQFFRWKVSSSDMDERYSSSPDIPEEGTGGEIGESDRLLDLNIYEVHPFLKMWKERLDA